MADDAQRPTVEGATSCGCSVELMCYLDGRRENVESVWRYCSVHAAAPELLAALTRAADTFEDYRRVLTMLNKAQLAEGAGIAENDARAAIAKATTPSTVGRTR